MQASIYLVSPTPPIFLSTKTPNTLFPAAKLGIKTASSSNSMSIIKAVAASDASEVDYSSMNNSVFPAEACETLGGVACDVEMFPETKLKQEQLPTPATTKVTSSQTTVDDREYLQYDNNPKTVFIAEACDDLGGEFCEPAYQSGQG